LGEDAFLEYLPDHVIPHGNSRLRQILRVELKRGSHAILYDAFTAGRVAHGERWKFREFDSRIEVFFGGAPIYLNRTWIQPAKQDPSCLGLFEEYSYAATLVVVSDASDACAAGSASMNDAIRAMPDILGGASLLGNAGCIAKFLARSASALLCAQTELWSLARQLIFHSPAVDLRKY
jgi:urease accessory protein